MADAVQSAARLHRRLASRSKRQRKDLWLGSTALVASLAALPLAPSSWHGPEVASTLAVSAVALLAGQRWAIALVVLAELLLLPTIWPRAFLGGVAFWPGRVAALSSLIMIVPGLLDVRRAAAAMVLLTGWRRTGQTCRRFHIAFVLLGLVTAALPLL